MVLALEDTIKIIKYDANWIHAFQLEKSRISSFLKGEAMAIEHVGSTSIPRSGCQANHRYFHWRVAFSRVVILPIRF
ncbi:GrpB family protein [Paenibacillus dendritiformis]|uniref:GrpB family protein n=1 Tax=Paenibacillus dendritiformis TaxID=130049 RepID=UPI003B97AB12